jgi:hypothetical protein
MKEITSHHDGRALNESIRVLAADEIGPGGAHHLYVFTMEDGTEVGRFQFQKGPRKEPGSTPGVTHQAILAALCDALSDFQKGPYPSREGAIALTKMQEAMFWFRARADERAARGVLGFTKP